MTTTIAPPRTRAPRVRRLATTAASRTLAGFMSRCDQPDTVDLGEGGSKKNPPQPTRPSAPRTRNRPTTPYSPTDERDRWNPRPLHVGSDDRDPFRAWRGLRWVRGGPLARPGRRRRRRRS